MNSKTSFRVNLAVLTNSTIWYPYPRRSTTYFQIGLGTLASSSSSSVLRIIESFPREVEHEIVEGHPYFAVTRADPPMKSGEVELI